MEPRREHRFKPNQKATVKVLGMRPGPIVQVSVVDISGSGMRLRSELPMPCGASVEIEVNGAVSRGRVCRCESGQDSYELGVQVSETGAAPNLCGQ